MARWKLNGEEIEETGYWGVRKSERLEIGKRRRRMKGSEERSESRGLGSGEVGRRGVERDRRWRWREREEAEESEIEK